MAKELTLEEALVKIEALQKENAELQEKVAAKESEVSRLNKEVPGTHKHKESGKTYRFKKGCLSFLKGGKRLISEEVIKDSKLMDELIEDGFGLIEVVESSK